MAGSRNYPDGVSAASQPWLWTLACRKIAQYVASARLPFRRPLGANCQCPARFRGAVSATAVRGRRCRPRGTGNGRRMAQIESLARFKVPLGGQEIELQRIVHDAGGMALLRIRIRERTRFTIFDVDPGTARALGRGDAALGARASRRQRRPPTAAGGAASNGGDAKRRVRQDGAWVDEERGTVRRCGVRACRDERAGRTRMAAVARARAPAAMARRRGRGGDPSPAGGAHRLRRGLARASRAARACGCPGNACPTR